MTQLGVAVVWCAVQIGVLGAIAWLVLLAARWTAPRARADMTLASLLLVSLLSALAVAPLPSWWDSLALAPSDETQHAATLGKSTATPAIDAAADAESAAGAASAGSASPRATGAASASIISEFAGAWRDELSAEPATPSPQPSRTRWWPAWVACGFLLLLIVGGLQLSLGLLVVRGYRRESLTVSDVALLDLVESLRSEIGCGRAVEMRQSVRLSTAATVGWRKPLILLPPDWREWTQAERRAVLVHELAHIARRDYLACLCGQIGLLLHYYHPVVHWLVRRMRLEQELAADAAAAAVSGGREAYLRVLAELALRQPDQRLPLPARSFLPTRSTFLRRIDMLRDPRRYAATTSRFVSALAVLLLLCSAVMVAGLRGPGAAVVAAPQPPATQRDGNADRQRIPFDTRFVSETAVYVTAFRPAAILARPEFKELAKILNESSELGIAPELIEEVVVSASLPAPGESRPRRSPFGNIVVRTSRPHDWSNSFGGMFKEGALQTHAGKAYYLTQAQGLAYFHPDDRTLVVDTVENIRKYLDGAVGKNPLVSSPAWRRVQRDDAAAAVDPRALRSVMEIEHGGAATTNLAPFWPIVEHCRALYCGGRLDQKLRINAYAVCDNEQGAKEVEETVAAMLTLGKNFLREAERAIHQSREADAALLRSGVGMALKLLEAASVEQATLGAGERRIHLVQIRAEAEFDADVAAPLAKATVAARAAAQRASTMNNFRQVALAMHNYHETHGHFPAASMLGPDGKTPHSWRVALLPFLEHDALYREYHFAEPWDSEHNKRLLEKMPAVYGAVGADGSTNAAVFVLTGPDAVFFAEPAKEGTKIVALRDGTSNTLLLVEAKRDIPWTKPEDIPYASAHPLPQLGGSREGGFISALADGSVHFFEHAKTPEDERQIRALITPSGGEAVNR